MQNLGKKNKILRVFGQKKALQKKPTIQLSDLWLRYGSKSAKSKCGWAKNMCDIKFVLKRGAGPNLSHELVSESHGRRHSRFTISPNRTEKSTAFKACLSNLRNFSQDSRLILRSHFAHPFRISVNVLQTSSDTYYCCKGHYQVTQE